ncbi:ABC transporter permease [Actinocorallia populi]|uniref:ABC transporter permease n=1 Tax=Actinocorallia populi TaxID=2079200 RepID=UPI000D095CEE|nr:ABC transporter permease [Actinocorallia populi]
MTVRGMLLVARLEFRTRLRTGRWKVLFGVWFLVVLVVSLLLRGAVTTEDPSEDGVEMFGTLLFFVLLLMMLISPALTAQTINGDRERGTLAPLQTTRLTPLEIASGKLLAAWAVGLAVLGLTLPFVAWPVLEGDVDPLRGVVCVAVTALLIGSACAVSQALSALVARSVTSALLSYLTVFALMFGTLLLFVLTMPLVTAERHYGTGEDAYTQEVTDTRRTWWLLAPSPFVILADAAPALPRRQVCSVDDSRPDDCYYENDDADVLGWIGREVRQARVGPQNVRESYEEHEWREESAPAVWPYGLGAHLLLAGGSLAVTARRLRVPAARLPRGVRVA